MPDVPDVCVVGAGPAGLTTAITLATAGRHVTILESGGLGRSRAAQELNDGDHEGDRYAGLRRTRHRQVGGTTNTWDVVVDGAPGAKYVPLDARDVAEWPIGWNELLPFYAEAQLLCGLGPFEYGAEYWATPERRPFALGGTGLKSGVYQFGLAECFTHAIVDELRGMETVEIVTDATVVELVRSPSSRGVIEVRALAEDGRALTIRPHAVVLACGAVENARLLLLAGIGHGAGSRWLGRCFMEHARDFSMSLIPSSPELLATAGFYDLWTSPEGHRIGGRLGVADEALKEHDLPNAAMTLVAKERRGLPSRILARAPRALRRTVKSRRGRYGWSRVASPEKVFDRLGIVLNVEQRPHFGNRIELAARRDRHGNPLPRLHLHWHEEEQQRLERLRELLWEWFPAAGLGELRRTPSLRPNLDAHHHAGTTRMALNIQEGVVDTEGRVFGLDNVYVAGASVFPSAGYANPTLTIVALARRLGRHLDAVLS